MTFTNAFIGNSHQPTERELTEVLGTAKSLWKQLLTELAQDFGLTEHAWHTYSSKAGWALRIRRRERNIIYLSPEQGGFQACLILGDKALAFARRNKLPRSAQRILAEAKRYPEGTALRIAVTKSADIELIKKFVQAKLEN